MKVKELQIRLAAMDPEMEVYLSRDEEGNGFHKLADCEEDVYRDGEPLHPEDIKLLLAKGTKLKESDFGLTLWP